MIAPTGLLTEASLRIAEEVKAVAHETGASAAQLAIVRTLLNPAVAAPLIGARPHARAGAGQPGRAGRHAGRGGRGAPGCGQPGSAIFPQRFTERPLVPQLVFGGAAVARRGA
ncbi:hypothetical protein C5614_22045 [Massilia phosphatilytica]|nr:hypothetical protein C5614_22045 [Massilia phosphatilytica]